MNKYFHKFVKTYSDYGNRNKRKIHQLIYNTKNNDLLNFYYHIILHTQNQKSTISNLTPSEIDELILSYNESFNSENLIDNSTVKNKFKEWF